MFLIPIPIIMEARNYIKPPFFCQKRCISFYILESRALKKSLFLVLVLSIEDLLVTLNS